MLSYCAFLELIDTHSASCGLRMLGKSSDLSPLGIYTLLAAELRVRTSTYFDELGFARNPTHTHVRRSKSEGLYILRPTSDNIQ